jgi:hypothetical protein
MKLAYDFDVGFILQMRIWEMKPLQFRARRCPDKEPGGGQ